MSQGSWQPPRPIPSAPSSIEEPHRVALLVDDGSNPFEMSCACEIFGASRRSEIGFDPYRLTVVAPSSRTRMRAGLFEITATGTLEDLAEAETVIVPNRPDVATPTRPAVLDAIRAAHERGARLVGLCTGAFTLAEAGLLDGRPAAVHWQLAAAFRARYPRVRAQPDVLFVDDEDILTSAGSAAALDLGLHIVRKDHGAAVAHHVSRRLVYASFRDGGQRQFAEHPAPEAADRSFAATIAWAEAQLDAPLGVQDLAAHAGVSVATVHRRFRTAFGTTPLAWLTLRRVELARRLLEYDAGSVEMIAARSGLGSAANLRALLRRHTGLTPSDYRARNRATSTRPGVPCPEGDRAQEDLLRT
ncbi:GlxA family transcriptional regulator [Tersicoccus sp. Bi-70]|uniref:GlxA family transcriptional regulator n=1 Tax=Tersicoccus sp. Bi-70 TaxID=1897634 RepID=UPI000975C771|nr:helix-turn-helix domain-containing protein [Tersicoccus sp. Bi-70]OMH34417.1 AraC family transcriptional regulator [Tersicoccus sp. Bi-70]